MSNDCERKPLRLGCVSYVNTLPLIDGLDDLADFQMRRSIPSALIDLMAAGDIDLGLISTIDYQRSEIPLQLLTAGMIGCDGPTLTVRIYSAVPVSEITNVHVDRDSHTSIALMQIILQEMHGIQPAITPYDTRERIAENKVIEWPETMLMIGDKVVTDSPPAVRYPHQLDLGEAWHAMTDLPFVYALWMCRADLSEEMRQRIRTASAVLDRQRRHNLERLEQFISRIAVPRGWPRDLARTYL
ncbi:MAG TPA: hypothetical protein ENJ06_02320, partial [Phycisphaeraceae bacterium]|nr:hypothetical protein [Phycisphaeraceae bacterium]